MKVIALGNPVSDHPLNNGLEFWALAGLRPYGLGGRWLSLTRRPTLEGVFSGAGNADDYPIWHHSPPGYNLESGAIYSGFGAVGDGVERVSFALPEYFTKNAGLNIKTCTVMCWYHVQDTGNYSGAFVKFGNHGSGTTGSGIGIGIGNGTFDLAGRELIFLGEGRFWNSTGDSSPGGWNHLAVSVADQGGDLANYTCYLNGRNIYGPGTNFSLTSLALAAGDGIHICGYTSQDPNNRHTNGIVVDDVRIFSRALGEDELVRQALERPLNYPNTLRRSSRQRLVAASVSASIVGPLVGGRLVRNGPLLGGRLVRC